MLVSEFLKLVPGLLALKGALVKSVIRGKNERGTSEPYFDNSRVDKHFCDCIERRPEEMTNWLLVERPPLYQDPKARYCAWCEKSLYTAYDSKDGLTPGWCPDHGKNAPVLHAETPPAEIKLPLHVVQSTLFSTTTWKPISPKMWDQTGTVGDSVPVRTTTPPKEENPVTEATQPMGLWRYWGLSGQAEFAKLAGVPLKP